MIKVDMLDAIKVQFIKPLCEEDFVQRGMKAWLTKIKYNKDYEAYELFFDMTEFEAENDKYFIRCYYPNSHTRDIPGDRSLFTAKEAGWYHPKFSSFLGMDNIPEENRVAYFEEEIIQYLKVVE